MLAYNVEAMRSRALHTTFAVSLGLHAALLGLLLLTVGGLPVPEPNPLRLRILPAPTPPQAVPAPPPPNPVPPPGDRGGTRAPGTRPGPAPGSGRIPEERVGRGTRGVGPDAPPRSTLRPPEESRPPTPGPAVPPQAGLTPPVTARPSPDLTPPPPVARREEQPGSPSSPRAGLSLGGPARDTLSPGKPAQGSAAPRPSFREQIAGIGSGLTEEGEGKQTINLDSREPRFLDYLSRLKWRIEQEWQYPEEAQRNRVGGELLLILTVNKAGVLTSLRLVESSGFPILDNEALRAVKAAAPFAPFPAYLGDEPWNIRATFRYSMLQRARRG